MTSDNQLGRRRFTPRKWTLLGTVAATGVALSGPGPISDFVVSPAKAQTVAGAAEGGEAGEAGVVRTDGPSAYLTELGLFEAAHRIVAALYAQGETDLAREHLEGSHHAYYEDLAGPLAEHGAAPFQAETEAFAEAVLSDAAAGIVAEAELAVLAAIAAAHDAAGLDAKHQLVSIKDLISIAAADFEGGVEAGQVSLAQEYRDAWGFVETARARGEILAASEDEATGKAGLAVLDELASLAPLFPGLTAIEVAGDSALLPGAAAWIEIIGLRLK